jgi:hypothetical protein
MYTLIGVCEKLEKILSFWFNRIMAEAAKTTKIFVLLDTIKMETHRKEKKINHLPPTFSIFVPLALGNLNWWLSRDMRH